MQIRRTSNVQNSSAVNLSSQNRTSAADQPGSAPVDQLDISAEAQAISQTDTTGDIRMDRVNELRAEIESGRYETADKLDAAITRMLDEIA